MPACDICQARLGWARIANNTRRFPKGVSFRVCLFSGQNVERQVRWLCENCERCGQLVRDRDAGDPSTPAAERGADPAAAAVERPRASGWSHADSRATSREPAT